MDPLDLDKQIASLFQKIIKNCQKQRKTKTSTSLRDLAKALGKTENYLSAVENGREFPSLQTFLTYLLILGFDLEPLNKLSVPLEAKTTKTLEPEKVALINKIYDLESKQVSFLMEQSKVAETIWGKRVEEKRGKGRG